MRINRWIWWATIILLYLRQEAAPNELGISTEQSQSEESESDDQWDNSTEKERAKTARELGVHSCESNQDCVHGGVCHRGKDGHGICLCPKSCPANIPKRCNHRPGACLIMDNDYREKYDVKEPTCYQVCSDMF
uniref:EGF-like domain-containing protein n=1 Tax=Caenorhabditis japonica TaxID=281687 RepID=A0A8R1DZL7_CAEJA